MTNKGRAISIISRLDTVPMHETILLFSQDVVFSSILQYLFKRRNLDLINLSYSRFDKLSNHDLQNEAYQPLIINISYPLNLYINFFKQLRKSETCEIYIFTAILTPDILQLIDKHPQIKLIATEINMLVEHPDFKTKHFRK
jgi:hypothetical protein